MRPRRETLIHATLLTSSVGVSAFALLLLSGCGVTSGTVIAKNYFPSYTSRIRQPQYQQTCTVTEEEKEKGSGRHEHEVEEPEKHCTSRVTGYRYVSERHPVCYQLTLKNGNRTGTLCVSVIQYYSVSVGQRFKEN